MKHVDMSLPKKLGVLRILFSFATVLLRQRIAQTSPVKYKISWTIYVHGSVNLYLSKPVLTACVL